MPTCDTHKSTWQGQWHCIINKMDFYFNLRRKEMALKVCVDYLLKWSHGYLWPIHVDVWQKPSQHCTTIILQLKLIAFKKENLIKKF